MLEKLYIKNFALIRELELEFDSGLNIITGETGAGKSIIVDATMLLLGERASTDYIREGEKKAIVEGVFHISDSHPAMSFIAHEGYDIDDSRMIIRREITEKNSRAFFNDSPIQIHLLKKLGDYLVDFHGQHDHQLLLKSETHIEALDIFADAEDLKNNYLAEYENLKSLIINLNDALRKEKSLKDKVDYINFELQEINKVNPKENEDKEIEDELRIRENSEMLYQLSTALFSLLYDEENSVYDKLQQIKKNLLQITDVDKKFEPYINDLETAIVNVSELSDFTNNYKTNIDFDPQKIEELRERYTALKGLIKKYGSIENTLAKKEELEAELNLSENFDAEIRKLKTGIDEQKKQVKLYAERLTGKRQSAGRHLEKDIKKILHDLGIPESDFKVVFSNETVNDDDKYSLLLNINSKNVKLFENGVDLVEFHISTNKGEKPKPLATIASGGEISRVMLAIKTIAADSDRLPMLVFDEIDSGISGRIAQKVGLSMKKLSKKHQIISITHLPQICALADRNVCVEKFESNGRTLISAHVLNENEKLLETARLISGEKITDSSMKSAKELIEAIN
ncbi:DNA repair protein RecN [Bacteroidota bacterium]